MKVSPDYPDKAFDYVILKAQTLQETRAPLKVISEMLRVGKRVAVAFPNFRTLAHACFKWSFSGRAPRSKLFLMKVVRVAQYPPAHRKRFRGAGGSAGLPD